MKSRNTPKIWPAALAVLVGVGAGAFFARRGVERTPAAPAVSSLSSSPAASPAPTVSASPGDRRPTEAATSAAAAAPLATAPSLPAGEAALQAIDELTVTYDAASVPDLARYLKHSDPEIRSAARDGLINLGERAAIPFLQEAAKTAPAEEATALREAADFLALPTWAEHREARKKAQAEAKAAGN